MNTKWVEYKIDVYQLAKTLKATESYGEALLVIENNMIQYKT
jgi:hypothetical protein